MENKKKKIFVFFGLSLIISFLVILSFLIGFYLSQTKTVISNVSSQNNSLNNSQNLFSSLAKKITLELSRIPSDIISLSFLPTKSIIDSNRSLKENVSLKKENQQLKISLMKLKELESENERLNDLLALKASSGFSLIAAKVIAFDSSNLRKSLVINKGRNYKIREGCPVITSEGLVGVVVEVSNLASRIMLINDIDFSIAAKVRRSNSIGVVSGSLEGMCKLRYLDLSENIQAGDEVISSGKNSRFPAGIPIGKIVRISKEQSGLTLFAVVKPEAKVLSLEEVLVVIDE